jgi:hypothetical protein
MVKSISFRNVLVAWILGLLTLGSYCRTILIQTQTRLLGAMFLSSEEKSNLSGMKKGIDLFLYRVLQ